MLLLVVTIYIHMHIQAGTHQWTTQVDLYSGGKMVDDGDDDRYEPNAPSRW